MSGSKVHIYYDGTCKMCSGIVQKLEHSSQGSLFSPTKIAEHLPEGVTTSEARRDVHAVDKNGTVYRGADAVLYIISQYPQWRWVAFMGRLPLIRQVVRILYRIIADNRQRFGLIKNSPLS